MSILEERSDPSKFVEFIAEELPAFYQWNIEQGNTLFQTLEILHKESFCHDNFTFDENLVLESDELKQYLTSLKLASKRSIIRIEALYGNM